MKKFLMLLMVAALMFSFGCTKDDDERTIDDVAIDANFETLVDYVEGEGGFAFLVAAPPASVDDVATFLEGYELIVDVRAADAYAAGHIEGAVNWAAGDFLTNLTAANPTGTVLIACYTGQTASFLQTVASLSGYTAKILKWGMSGWNNTLAGSWDGNTAESFTAWSEDDEIPEADWYDTPVITEAGTGEVILETRLATVLAGGLQGTMPVTTLADEYVINYWGAADYENFGHIENAYQIAGGAMTTTANLYNVPADEEVFIYCWTGQTSAALTTYLNVLGYNTKSVKFGANGMVFEKALTVHWHLPSVDLPLVTG